MVKIIERKVERPDMVTGPTPRRGRKSPYAGKVFHARSNVNPFKEGTRKWKSMEIFATAFLQPVSFETFLSRGGRTQDLKAGIDVDYIKEIDNSA